MEGMFRPPHCSCLETSPFLCFSIFDPPTRSDSDSGVGMQVLILRDGEFFTRLTLHSSRLHPLWCTTNPVCGLRR